ncbi:hypothetical protein SASPL_127845 [Salvia splendens]|uniref:BZIP domain-containing protein n=1 Tax=Salvia splendens TaxID=180675 RepID=A0A8X8XCX1_SALSN|nr:bZIP transcription factor 16-like [Salvia splendens]XP_042002312.1 bZIP transcription factor 16-like [Salvia splendens]XP_042002313.1 bZIP transcription factor 16-like [Salvia splendens]XP_042002314.1 bZIP transcription factor 16-like [Salvia splendens]XP_042002315.1 bZIP transcription factor 16-like [Salvia splendens]KAG6409803.1 hypothetical protein SASPL_127845 [Salvia splendens]
MSGSDVDKTPKEGKEPKEPKTPSAQEQASSASGAVPADWSGFQTYSPMPPHGFLASSPQAHPYMWGVQQFIPPYGTPPHPYVAMYPPGGIYGHPTMAPGSYPFSPFAMPSPNGIVEAPCNVPGNMEVDGKSSEGKGKLPIKRSKGSLGSLNMITGKNDEPGKASGATANGAHPKSAGTASEGSSEGSDENSQNESQEKSSGRPDSAEPPQSGGAPNNSQNGTSHAMANQAVAMVPMPAPAVGAVSGVPGPTTNLNIGMDYWGAGQSSAMPAMRGKVPATPAAGGIVATGSPDMQSQLWIQDERELKKQRRKQSNRESARRSRLRKQAECDELAQCAEALNEENATLKAEVSRMKSKNEQLAAQNASLKERLGEVSGGDDPRCSRDEQRASNNDTQ